MEFKGMFRDLMRDWKNCKSIIMFEVDGLDINPQQIVGKVLRITAVQWREKRSLDANAYMWVLLTKQAEALKISKTRAYNIALRRYGQPEIIDGSVMYTPIPDTEEAEETAIEAETFHIKPTSQVMAGKDGVMYRTYKMIRGSSTYDTKEMSELIDGIVSDCKDLGIDTATPDEIKHMLDLYEQNRGRHEKTV